MFRASQPLITGECIREPFAVVEIASPTRLRRLMAKERILVVGSEAGVLELVEHSLPEDAYHVIGVTTVEKAFAEVTAHTPDLILLDLMFPVRDGLSACRELKNNPKTRYIPVIILAAQGKDPDIAAGLEFGADGYLLIPFSPRVLVAVVRAVLRRKSQQAELDDSVVNINGLMIDPLTHRVIVNGTVMTLTATQFSLLHFLARRPGLVFSRDQIIRSVRGRYYSATYKAVDVQIMWLRRKLGDAGRLIETVRGVGFRFRA